MNDLCTYRLRANSEVASYTWRRGPSNLQKWFSGANELSLLDIVSNTYSISQSVVFKDTYKRMMNTHKTTVIGEQKYINVFQVEENVCFLTHATPLF